ncbi:MAG: hypothetical protein KC996_09305 [Phycisphaerales bacterium]|nr:hypothetical protein [Phycisphaerales bacterium]
MAEDTAPTRAPLNTKWVVKMAVVIAALLLFAVLGFYDATVKYPARGERYASYTQWQYLDAARNANNEDFGVFERESSVSDPIAELKRLQDPQTQLSTRPLRSSMQMARRTWLEALQTIGRLKPEYTSFDSPAEKFDELAKKWGSTTSLPKPLKSYDIPLQWLILIVCLPLALYVMLRFVRVKALKYTWDESNMELTVPCGASITPADLEEVDKRKWDKFIVFLKLKDEHPTHGGKEIKVDTYQHKYVEEWILAMEKDAFGSQEEDDASAPAPDDNETSN